MTKSRTPWPAVTRFPRPTSLTGPGITPLVLGAIADTTGGDSIPANRALAENNAKVATEIAVALAAT